MTDTFPIVKHMPGIVIDIGRNLRGLVYTSWARHVSNAGLRLRERGDGAGGAEEGGVPAEGGVGRQGRLEGRTQPGHQVRSDNYAEEQTTC